MTFGAPRFGPIMNSATFWQLELHPHCLHSHGQIQLLLTPFLNFYLVLLPLQIYSLILSVLIAEQSNQAKYLVSSLSHLHFLTIPHHLKNKLEPSRRLPVVWLMLSPIADQVAGSS